MSFQHLSVLVAANPGEAELLLAALAYVGHEVKTADLKPETAVADLRRHDVEIVIVPREHGEGALQLIGELTHEGAYPVVAAVPEMDVEWVELAASAGASSAIVGLDPELIRISLHTAWQRWKDYRGLQEAFLRRATIEQAKGLVMARHSINGDKAFALLRQHSQRSNRKLIEIADALVKAHIVLSGGNGRTDTALDERTA